MRLKLSEISLSRILARKQFWALVEPLLLDLCHHSRFIFRATRIPNSILLWVLAICRPETPAHKNDIPFQHPLMQIIRYVDPLQNVVPISSKKNRTKYPTKPTSTILFAKKRLTRLSKFVVLKLRLCWKQPFYPLYPNSTNLAYFISGNNYSKQITVWIRDECIIIIK